MVKCFGLIFCLLAASRLDAQGLLSPRLDVGVGPHAIHTTYQGFGSATSSSGGMNALAGVSLGIGLSRRVAIDGEYRSAFGGDWSFKVMSVGVTVRQQPSSGPYLRFAIARMEASEAITCVARFGCPGSHGENRGGLEATFGMDFSLGGHASAGPMLWWARSGGKLPKYRTIGLGLHVGAF